MTIRAVLFDVGGPIDTEVIHEALVETDVLRALRDVGVTPTGAEFEAANRWAIESFAPDAYSAILWKLAGNERLARTAYELFAVHVRDVKSSLLRPDKELKGFAKLQLAAGESRLVTIELGPNAFEAWDPRAHEWVAEPGAFEILVGLSSDRLAAISVELTA